MNTYPQPIYGCETYPDWLVRVLASGDLDELRRGRVRS